VLSSLQQIKFDTIIIVLLQILLPTIGYFGGLSGRIPLNCHDILRSVSLSHILTVRCCVVGLSVLVNCQPLYMSDISIVSPARVLIQKGISLEHRISASPVSVFFFLQVPLLWLSLHPSSANPPGYPGERFTSRSCRLESHCQSAPFPHPSSQGQSL